MKKKLLISYGNPYIFYEVIFPYLETLASEFQIWIAITGKHFSNDLIKNLEIKKSEKIIEDMVLIDINSLISSENFNKFKKVRRLIDECRFDLVLTCSETDCLNQRILNLKNKPLFCTLITQLGYNLLDYDFIEKNNGLNHLPWSYINMEGYLKSNSFMDRLRNKFTGGHFFLGLFSVLEVIVKRVTSPIQGNINRFKTKIHNSFIDKAFNGSSIPFNETQNKTKLFFGESDYVFYVDEFEKGVMEKSLPKSKVKVVKYPSYKKSDKQNENSKKLLFLLTTGYCAADRLGAKELSALLSEINEISKRYEVNQIDLKPHPRESKKWPEHLSEALVQSGFNVRIVNNAAPIRELVSDYKVVSGFASSSFRDAANALPGIKVCGIERISIQVGHTISPNKKLIIPLWFGDGYGIDWLRLDNKIYSGQSIDVVEKFPEVVTELVNICE